jgi:hypothetical protein
LERPDSPRCLGVLLVLDDHVTMRVWDETVGQLAEASARQEQLGDITTVRLLSSDDTEPARIRLEPLPPVDAGHRVVLVLRELGRSEPFAVLHWLPQRLWFRTGLDVYRMRLRAERPWAPNDSLGWELRTSPLEPVDDPAARLGVVPVPVLELTERSLSCWADLVAGRGDGWLEMSGVRAGDWKRRPDAARAVPWIEDVPDPASAVPPWERVSEFWAAASPTAFALATRLTAASLTLPAMRPLPASVPGTGPAHLTELLMSGLVRPAGADARAADVAFTSGPNIRQ